MCKDHLGNVYKNVSIMCNAYGISLTEYCNRIHKGWDIRDVLTKECNTEILDVVYDHKGNAYSSLVSLCEAYGISVTVYLYRIKSGWSVQKALTYPVRRFKFKNKQPVYDFKGNAYNTQVDMCIHYGIDPSIYRYRIKAGWSVERALITPTKSVSILNGKGDIKYRGVRQYAQANNIGESCAYITNRQTRKPMNYECCLDHLGNWYATVADMCSQYNINKTTYYTRLRSGRSKEEALTSPLWSRK